MAHPGGISDADPVETTAVFDLRDGRHAARLAVRECAAPAHSPPAPSERRRRDDRHVDQSFAFQRQQCSPNRDAANVVSRPVDRVDDPARLGPVVAEFLAEDALPWALTRDELANCLLGSAIGLGDRGQVRFRLDAEVERTEARECDRIGAVGELLSEREVGAHGPPRYWTTATRWTVSGRECCLERATHGEHERVVPGAADDLDRCG